MGKNLILQKTPATQQFDLIKGLVKVVALFMAGLDNMFLHAEHFLFVCFFCYTVALLSCLSFKDFAYIEFPQ